jgi:acetylornithine/succinyldiaminopimelate/putrescine aminotransferase
MIFPFALTLVSATVERRLADRNSSLLADLAERCDYETGVRSVLGTLRRAESNKLEMQVNRQADRLAKCLRENLAGKRGVREVRCFGLLVGIELDMSGVARRWLARRVPQLYLLEMLRERRFPILVGFCQYEPHVLKLTPPLSITDAEVDEASRTLADVLTRSLPQVLGGTLKSLLSRAIGYDQ